MTPQEIEKKIVKLADVLDFDVNTNLSIIAKVKSKQDDWRSCPCHPQDEFNYCGSKYCENCVKVNGKCGCNLFLRKKIGE